MERLPDRSRNDCLLPDLNGQDLELAEVIARSREEYMAAEIERRARLERKTEWRRKLAVPISRLQLWKASTVDQGERECLQDVLRFLEMLVDPETNFYDLEFPRGRKPTVARFMRLQLEGSELYRPVCEACLPYL